MRREVIPDAFSCDKTGIAAGIGQGKKISLPGPFNKKKPCGQRERVRIRKASRREEMAWMKKGWNIW